MSSRPLQALEELPSTFHAGCPCFIKKGSVPAIITAAVGAKTWTVVELDQNGNDTRERECRSQQLRRIKPGEHHPLIINPDDMAKVFVQPSEESVEQMQIDNKPTTEPSEARQSIDPPETGNVSPSSRSNNINFSFHQDDDSTRTDEIEVSEETATEQAQDKTTDDQQAMDINRASTEEDADLDLEEDFAFAAEDNVDEDGEQVNFLAMGQAVEVNDDKYKKKWERYIAEKKKLVDKKYSIKIHPPRNQGVDIGVRVQERGGDKRKGLVLSSDRDEAETNAPPCWAIRFDGIEEPQHNVPSTSIKVIPDKRIFKWVTVEDSFPERPVQPFKKHGVVGFDFSAFDEAKLNIDNAEYDFPYLRLLMHLWPGTWREQLANLNIHIEDVNRNAAKSKKISVVSEFEWWAFWGCIFAACPAGESGEVLFRESKIRKLVKSLNLGPHGLNIMSWTRFKNIRQHMPHAFYDLNNPDDPYHPVNLLVDGFNDNRRKNIATAIKIVLDESMSPFQPRTTKTSRLPNISFIFRKPKPLGVENKNAGCSKTRTLLFQEIQRGKLAMRKKRFFPEVGATTACTLRLILGSVYCGQRDEERRIAQQQQRRYLIVADSWFGSVKLAETVKLLYSKEQTLNDAGDRKWDCELDKEKGENPNGHEVIVAVKTNSSWFPKKELESKMKTWPSGAHFVLTCKTPETGVDLVALGYKYNARKVLCFVMTKNAGSTKLGAKSYIARFPDKYGNLKERRIQRPEVLSKYFEDSNVIDCHNHCRQHNLGLERLWRTNNPWFRYDCTMIGMTAIDAYRGIQFAKPYLKQTVVSFTDSLAWDCVFNPYSKDKSNRNGYIPATGEGASAGQSIVVESFRQQSIQVVNNLAEQFCSLSLMNRSCDESFLTIDSALNEPFNVIDIGEHDAIGSTQKSKHDEKRSAKRKCIICKMDTRAVCNNGFCKSRVIHHRGQQVYGTPICNPLIGPCLNLQEYGGESNRSTCLQIHRDKIRAAKHDEYKEAVARRMVAESK